MPEPTILDLQSSTGRPLRHKYFQQDDDPKGILFIFPGDNYGVDGPLLYYPGHMLWGSGWDTFAITYGYQSEAKPFSMDIISGMFEECGRVVQTVLNERAYPRIALLGKSIGAALVAALCGTEEVTMDACAVYLTPPLGVMFDQAFSETAQRAYLAIGTKDRFYSVESLESFRSKRDCTVSTFAGADHSLNVEQNFDQTIDYLERLTAEVFNFIDR